MLETACGAGRVSIPITRQGFAVTGLDIVPGMLKRARIEAEADGLSTRWVEGDARSFDLGERFRLIFLTNADQEALLGSVRAHLHDEGIFAFETRNPRWRTRENRDEDPGGLFVHLETRAEHETLPPYTSAHGREGGEERTETTRTSLRYTFPQELAALLHRIGLTIERQYGEPLAAASTIIIVASRKRERSEGGP